MADLLPRGRPRRARTDCLFGQSLRVFVYLCNRVYRCKAAPYTRRNESAQAQRNRLTRRKSLRRKLQISLRACSDIGATIEKSTVVSRFDMKFFSLARNEFSSGPPGSVELSERWTVRYTLVTCVFSPKRDDGQRTTYALSPVPEASCVRSSTACSPVAFPCFFWQRIQPMPKTLSRSERKRS